LVDNLKSSSERLPQIVECVLSKSMSAKSHAYPEEFRTVSL